MTVLAFITWLMTLSDSNKSTMLCVVAFMTFVSSCSSPTPITP